MMATQTLPLSAERTLSFDEAQHIVHAVRAGLADPDPLMLKVARLALKQRPSMSQTAALDLAARICA